MTKEQKASHWLKNDWVTYCGRGRFDLEISPLALRVTEVSCKKCRVSPDFLIEKSKTISAWHTEFAGEPFPGQHLEQTGVRGQNSKK